MTSELITEGIAIVTQARKMISNSLVIDFIRSDIQDCSCKEYFHVNKQNVQENKEAERINSSLDLV